MMDTKSLHILWTNDNKHTSQLMVISYATTCMVNHLWERITVIIWGAPVYLVAEDQFIQEQIKVAQNIGVKFSACISCARQFGVVEKLESHGIEVVPWVVPFTNLLKNGDPLLYV